VVTSWSDGAIVFTLPTIPIGTYQLAVDTAGNGDSQSVPYAVSPEIQFAWVADSVNNRVLQFQAPLTSGEAASLVIGPTLQGQTPLANPSGVTVDPIHDRLWIADTGNSRVLQMAESNSGIGTLTTVSTVIGQPFSCPSTPGSLPPATASTPGSIPPATASSFCNPAAIAMDNNADLWVADTDDNRVLEFLPPYTQGPSVVIGQSSYTQNQSAHSATGLFHPVGLAFDQQGDLWVADMLNSRVLEYPPPFTNGEAATFVLGQPNLNANGFNQGQETAVPNGLANPTGVAFDMAGDLWIADEYNSRVLEFIPQSQQGAGTFSESPSVVIGESTTYSGDVFSANPCTSSAIATQAGQCMPVGLFFDAANDLWVADTLNNRVLEYTPQFSTGQDASLELGQLGFSQKTPGAGMAGLYFPTGGVWEVFREP
jgi:sugar lactone lactonase YvrE